MAAMPHFSRLRIKQIARDDSLLDQGDNARVRNFLDFRRLPN
jgi:hypothetical protein